MYPVIIIYGPTAVGKSAISVCLAKKVNGEIISADSMQIYKHLDIGSAKITQDEMEGIPHHLIDFLEPNEEYNVSLFCDNCKMLIEDIISRGKTPIIVGGTGLYINSLINGYDFGKTSKNNEFREELEKLSNEELYNKIIALKSDYIVDKDNRRRLIRALEKLTFGEVANASSDLKYPYILFAICDDRQKIYNRINNRVEKMVNSGLLDEAKYILDLNLDENALCMKAIGYKELFPYLKGEDSLNNCVELLKQKTRNYAKRQFTFMNQFDNLNKVDFCGVEETVNNMLCILNKQGNN